MEESFIEPTPEEWVELAEDAKRMYIDTFSDGYHNIIDSTIEKSIAELRDSHKENLKSYSDMVRKFGTPESEEEYIRQAEEKYYASMFYTEDLNTAFALYELRIMYSCKYFEIKVHELSRTAFDDWSGNNHWETVVKGYSKRGILIDELANYKPIDELRRVCNGLKHTGDRVTSKMKDIAEFEGLSYFRVGHLKAFYERVKDAPKAFMDELSSATLKNLFPNRKSTNIESEFGVPDIELHFE